MNNEFLLKTVQELRELIVGGKPADLREAVTILNCLYRQTHMAVESEKHYDYDPSRYVVDFGKYAGKTVVEIGAVDRPYLDWLYNYYPHKGHDFTAMVHGHLQQIRETPT